MKELPFDPNQFLSTPSGGYVAYPEGYYLLEVTDVDTQQAYKSSPGTYTRYRTKIVLGPNATTEKKDRPYSDMIGDGKTGDKERDTRDMQAHKALWSACMGGEEALAGYLQQLAASGHKIDAGVCVGYRYIVLLVPNKQGTNNFVNARLPYTDETWAYVTQQQVGSAMPQAAPPAPPAQPMAPAQPAAPPAPPAAPAAPAAPAQGMVPPPPPPPPPRG